MAAPLAEVAPTDAELVQRYAGGDRWAFEELVRRHQRKVMAIALRFAGDMDDAKDLAQQAFVQAMDKARSWRGAGAFQRWLYRIAVNLAKNHLRSAARFAPEESAPERTAGPEQEERLVDARERRRLREATARLPARQREVVLLRVDAEMSFAEIGEVLGIEENNAKVSYHHAVGKLRGWLAEDVR